MISSKQHWMLLLAATAACATLAPSAMAQYQTENNTGRALDANNRLGAGGVNEQTPNNTAVTPNDLIYGTVTRGKQVRQGQEFAPGQFHGNITHPSDLLVRDAGPSVYDRSANYDPTQAQRFWGDSRGVTAPQGFQQVQVGSPGQFIVNPSPYRVPGDIRMDAAIPNPDLGLTSPTQYILPGVSPETGRPVTYTAAPDVPSIAAANAMPSSDTLRRLDLTEAQIKQMREELQRTGGQDAINPADLTVAPESPVNDPLSSGLNNAINAQAMSGSLNTDQTLRQRLLEAARVTAKQDEQYALLQNRLQRFRQNQNLTDQEANQQFMQEWQQAQEAQKKQQPDQTKLTPAEILKQQQQEQQPGVPQPKTETPGTEDQTLKPNLTDRARIAAKIRAEQGTTPQIGTPTQPDIPFRIISFADGVKANGLKTLLTDAEKAMAAGKFTQALDYYDAAAAVAPDNSMILMGQAVAELGAGYYARAQIHLERVLSADPSLLMARYDLKTFYGEDRLQYIVRDLKDLATIENRQSRPLFLLAFIAYSTENEQRTLDYLNMAQQRGGSATFYQQLREYWRLDPESKKKPAIQKIEPR